MATVRTPGGGAGVGYQWVRIGLQADRLALDPTSLLPGTIFTATDGAATPKPYIVGPDQKWAVFAAPSHHAEQHYSTSTIDPLTYANLGSAPAANIGLAALDSALQALILNAVQAGSGGASQGGTILQTAVPLNAGDTFRSGPLPTTGSTQVKAYVLADQTFTARLDTSVDGVTFATGTPTYTAQLVNSDYTVLAPYSVSTAYVRLTVICGATTMARMSASTISVAVAEATIGTPG